MILQLKAILYNTKTTDDMMLDIVFLGEHESISYNDLEFKRIKTSSINFDNFNKYSFEFPENCTIMSIKKEDFDSNFIELSDNSIIRFNTTDKFGKIFQELTIEKYTPDLSNYYWSVKKWCDLSELLTEKNNVWYTEEELNETE